MLVSQASPHEAVLLVVKELIAFLSVGKRNGHDLLKKCLTRLLLPPMSKS
jgi:hypothetical protein